MVFLAFLLKTLLGFSIIVEMLANVNLSSDLKLVAPQGRIIVVGNRGTVSDFDPRQCMQKESAIIGLMASVTTPDVIIFSLPVYLPRF